MISTWKSDIDVLNKKDSIDYDYLYNNVYNREDLDKYFETYRLNALDDDWGQCLSSSKCDGLKEDYHERCLGCVLKERVSKANTVREHTNIFEEYSCPDDDNYKTVLEILDWNTTCDVLSTCNGKQHKILLLLLFERIIPEYSHLLFFYICKESLITITKLYNYGQGTFDVLINNSFTSYITEGIRYLNREIIEGIIYQLFYQLFYLSIYNYTHGTFTLDSLAFTDDIFMYRNKTYSFKLFIVPNENGSLTYDSVKYIYRGDINIDIDNLSNKELMIYSRDHCGVSVDSGEYNFFAFIKLLMNDSIFSRSIEREQDLLRLTKDNCWEHLMNNIDKQST